ncbi:MAG: c-type cytochrome [Verrucomicrobiia bacterium]
MKQILLTLACLALAGSAFGADDATIQRGEKVFDYWCATCHGANLPGTMALEAKYKGAKPALLTERTDLIPAVTKTFVRKGVSVMPFFRKTEVSDADLDALAAYLARNNKSGKP